MLVLRVRYLVRNVLLKAFKLIKVKYSALFEDEIEYVLNYPDQGAFLDVGANVGSYIQAAKQNKNFDLVVGIEPVPFLFGRLQRIFKNGAFIINGVLSNETGQGKLLIPLFDGVGKFSRASLNKEQFDDGSRLESIEVKSFTLDSIRSKMDKKFSFVKVDVEGHELSVLQGAKETIVRDKPTFLIEIELSNYSSFNEFFAVFDFLSNFGYECYIWKNGLHPLSQSEIESFARAKIFNNWIFKNT